MIREVVADEGMQTRTTMRGQDAAMGRTGYDACSFVHAIHSCSLSGLDMVQSE